MLEGFSSCGVWAWLPHGMGDLPGPESKSGSPVLAGRFFSTEPPVKPSEILETEITRSEDAHSLRLQRMFLNYFPEKL